MLDSIIANLGILTAATGWMTLIALTYAIIDALRHWRELFRWYSWPLLGIYYVALALPTIYYTGNTFGLIPRTAGAYWIRPAFPLIFIVLTLSMLSNATGARQIKRQQRQKDHLLKIAITAIRGDTETAQRLITEYQADE